MNTKLGLHVSTGSRNGYVLTAPFSRGIVAFDGGGSIDETSEDCFIMLRPPKIYKWPPDSGGTSDIMPGFDSLKIEDMPAQAEYYWPFFKAAIDEAAANHGRVDATQITNETGGNDPFQLRKLVAFENRMGELAHADGYRIAVANLGTNSPHWDNYLWQSVIAPHVVKMWELGHFYERHAYADSVNDVDRLIVNGQPAGESSGRPFKEIEFFHNKYGFCGPIILGEIGFVTMPGVDHFMQEVIAYDKYMQQYPEIGYGAIFEYGEWNSGQANIEAASEELGGYLAANPFVKWVPVWNDVTDPPSEKYKAIIVKLPQDATLEEVIEAATENFPKRHTFTQSHDDMLRMLSGGNDESYAVVWWPERQPDIIELLEREGYNYVTMPEERDPFAFTHWPTPHRVVTQEFLANPQNYEQFGLVGHEGADIRAFHDDPIMAVADGVISHLNTNPDKSNYGIYIRVKHKDSYETTYAHLKETVRSVGETVKGGDIIGLADNTGNSFGDHLHLTLKKIGETYTDRCGNVWPYNIVDPTPYLAAFASVSWPGGSPGFPCPEEPQEKLDLLPYIRGDGRLYEVRNSDGGQERFQTQIKGFSGEFWQTKNSLAEQLIGNTYHIYRGWDLSPGNGRFFVQQQDSLNFAKWLPRKMAVGESFSDSLRVQFYNWECEPDPENSGNVTDIRRFVAHYDTWTSPFGITLNDVIEIEWVNGEETYFYARGFGLVGWRRDHDDPHTPEYSGISEIHEPGQRPDNVVILPSCLGTD